jgi:benzoate membrane transport protein
MFEKRKIKVFKNYNLNHLTAGFVTVLVGFTASVAIVFQAAVAAGGTEKDVASWVFALSLGMALSNWYFSFKYKIPILTAWSTPGAAILVLGLSGFTMPEATGAFMFSAFLIFLFGITGWFEKMMNRIPMQIASAMLAGVLFKFGLDVFTNMKTHLTMCLILLFVYLMSKRFFNRYTMVIVLLTGIATTYFSGEMHFGQISFELIQPVFTMPEFSLKAIISLAIPLFIVTMTAQNIPGVTILKAHNYHPPVSRLMTGLGFINFLLAPFGAFSLNLAAITAAISMGPNVDENPHRRYYAAVTAGFFYLIIALFAGSVAALFYAFPKELVMTIAGLALFHTISTALLSALKDEKTKEASFITFLMAVSGVSILGIGSAFWSLVAGLFSYAVLEYRKRLIN